MHRRLFAVIFSHDKIARLLDDRRFSALDLYQHLFPLTLRMKSC